MFVVVVLLGVLNYEGIILYRKLRRKIELGWMYNGKYVWSFNGGGSCKIEFLRDVKKVDILEVVKEIFFLNG